MRTRLGAGLVVALWVVASGALPAAGADTGTIKGRVINGETSEPIAGVEVTLTSGSTAGTPQRDTVPTDEDGRFSFPDLPTGDDNIYALDASYDGGLFPGRALTIPDDTEKTPVINTTLRVWPTTTEPAVIAIARNDLFVAQDDEGQLGVIESFQITNTSTEAYIGRGATTSDVGGSPSLGFSLPARAQDESVQIIDSTLDIPALIRTDFGFGLTTAIPPGRFQITFSYSVPGTAATYDISRRALYPTLNFAIFANEGLEISSNRLDEKDDVEVGGKTYREYSTDEPLDPGDSIQVVALADAGTPPGLILGMAGVLLLVVALGAIPFLRVRRGRKRSERPSETRADLMQDIAELDLRHDNGELSDEEWATKRAELKARIGNTR